MGKTLKKENVQFTYSLPDVTISIEKNQNITIYGDIVL